MLADAQLGPLRVGEQFLNYRVQGLIGKGGHAWVYQGHNEFLDHHVAIKVLHRPSGVTKDMLRRGQAEAKLLFRIRHDNIVEVFDAGMTERGLLYIVMELMRGRSLRELLRDRVRLPLETALPMFAAIAEGVHAAHLRKTIHRDLKPENIFVLEDGRPKVLDFGIAKITDAAGWTTEKDIVHGTLLYMAPEQLEGQRATACSDVYALGLVLYETILGRHPCLLANPNPNARELTRIQMGTVPPRLDALDPGVPRNVGRLVARMLEKLPARRVASMTELGEAIRECLRNGVAAPVTAPSVALETERVAVDSADVGASEPRDTVPIEPGSLFDTSTPARDEVSRVQTPEFAAPLNPASTRTQPVHVGSKIPPARARAAGGTAPPVTTGTGRARPAAETGRRSARRELLRVFGASLAIGGVASAALMMHLTSEERPSSASIDESGHISAATIPTGASPLASVVPRAVGSIAPSVPQIASAPRSVVVRAIPSASPSVTRAEPKERKPAPTSASSIRKVDERKSADSMQARLRWLEDDLGKKPREAAKTERKEPVKAERPFDPKKDPWFE